MTRFARAKGSKSSNLKSPEDSTPWEVMKEHMLKAKNETEESKKREEAEQQRIENYNNFLKEHRVQKRKATWCDFPESNDINLKKSLKSKEKTSKKEKEDNTKHCHNKDNNTEFDDKRSNVLKKKKKKPIKEIIASLGNDGVLTSEEKIIAIKDKKKINKKKKKLGKNTVDMSSNDISKTATQDMPINVPAVKKIKNQNKRSSLSESKIDEVTNNGSVTIDSNKKVENSKNIINKQAKNGKPNRRKPINDNSFKIIINGKEVQLVRFDGFPIMKKDVDRLEELKKSMIQKGIPKSEVQRTMKLERRRAEKALARVKRDVCYNCRKGGHNLSDCPDLKSNIPGVEAAEGVCFKCGSTEHRQFECKVQRDKEFRFATCFICKESGHIARQCPDNPKGLYPNGGSCKLCGDVTHLRKDCPTVNNKKEETSIKLHTLNDDNIEDIGYQPKSVSQETVKKPKKIKF